MPTIKFTDKNLYPPGVLRLLESPPIAGNGLNKWMIRAATAFQGHAGYDDAYSCCWRARSPQAGRNMRRNAKFGRALNAVTGFTGDRPATQSRNRARQLRD